MSALGAGTASCGHGGFAFDQLFLPLLLSRGRLTKSADAASGTLRHVQKSLSRQDRAPGYDGRTMKKLLRVVVLAGLVLGAVLGMAGTLVSSAVMRSELWAIDGTAVLVSTVVLTLYFFRQGCDGVAAGFLVYAIGEAVMLGGTASALRQQLTFNARPLASSAKPVPPHDERAFGRLPIFSVPASAPCK